MRPCLYMYVCVYVCSVYVYMDVWLYSCENAMWCFLFCSVCITVVMESWSIESLAVEMWCWWLLKCCHNCFCHQCTLIFVCLRDCRNSYVTDLYCKIERKVIVLIAALFFFYFYFYMLRIAMNEGAHDYIFAPNITSCYACFHYRIISCDRKVLRVLVYCWVLAVFEGKLVWFTLNLLVVTNWLDCSWIMHSLSFEKKNELGTLEMWSVKCSMKQHFRLHPKQNPNSYHCRGEGMWDPTKWWHCQ